MKHFLLLLLTFSILSIAEQSAFAYGVPAMKYKSVDCSLFQNDKLVQQHSQPLMTLMIEESFGRFAQIQFGDASQVIQYQILIEDDLANAQEQYVLFLQNLKVGDVESSSEFSVPDAKWVRIVQGPFSVRCQLNK